MLYLIYYQAYIAGEASEESRSLVEEFAQNDSQIANLIRTGKLETDPISQKTAVPDDLELKTIKHIRHSIRLKVWYVAFATAAILVAPLVAMQFTDEVNWGLLDFIVMGFLLFGTGLTYVLISRISERIAYRTAVGVAVVAGFLLIWMNLAVGIIGSENNPVNLIYLGVLAIGIIGAVISHLRPLGMARTMFASAIAQMLVPVIVLIFWRILPGRKSRYSGCLRFECVFRCTVCNICVTVSKCCEEINGSTTNVSTLTPALWEKLNWTESCSTF